MLSLLLATHKLLKHISKLCIDGRRQGTDKQNACKSYSSKHFEVELLNVFLVNSVAKYITSPLGQVVPGWYMC